MGNFTKDMKSQDFEGEVHIDAFPTDDDVKPHIEGKISDALAEQLAQHPIAGQEPIVPPIDRLSDDNLSTADETESSKDS